MKEEFRKLLLSVNREGMDKLLEFIDATDFYTAPASTRFHGSYEGGLLEHSLKVYEILKEKVKHTPIEMEVSEDTLIISALLHDICKVKYYKVDYRNAKNELGVWEKVPYYTVEDKFPFGHGEKSVFMIERYIRLTKEEAMAIRWHMGFTEPKENWNCISAAIAQYPLVLALHLADLEATYLLEEES